MNLAAPNDIERPRFPRGEAIAKKFVAFLRPQCWRRGERYELPDIYPPEVWL